MRRLPEYLDEVGLSALGEETPFDDCALVAQLRGRLSGAAAAAEGEHPDNDKLRQWHDGQTGRARLRTPPLRPGTGRRRRDAVNGGPCRGRVRGW